MNDPITNQPANNRQPANHRHRVINLDADDNQANNNDLRAPNNPWNNMGNHHLTVRRPRNLRNDDGGPNAAGGVGNETEDSINVGPLENRDNPNPPAAPGRSRFAGLLRWTGRAVTAMPLLVNTSFGVLNIVFNSSVGTTAPWLIGLGAGTVVSGVVGMLVARAGRNAERNQAEVPNQDEAANQNNSDQDVNLSQDLEGLTELMKEQNEAGYQDQKLNLDKAAKTREQLYDLRNRAKKLSPAEERMIQERKSERTKVMKERIKKLNREANLSQNQEPLNELVQGYRNKVARRVEAANRAEELNRMIERLVAETNSRNLITENCMHLSAIVLNAILIGVRKGLN